MSRISRPGQKTTRRPLRVQTLEPRRLMAADTIHVGVVYLETDYLESDQDVGSDSRGDRFLLSFAGGAPGTSLTEVRIDTDKDGDGISIGDPLFDTVVGGRGKLGVQPFAITRLDSGGSVAASVDDGGQVLVLRFENFFAGDRLEFTIDVDEVLRNHADLDRFNQALDVITSGQEFEDVRFAAAFDAPDYFEATTSGVFRNEFGDPSIGTGLRLPADESSSVDSRPNRSAGVVGSVDQTPIPASIAGWVYIDGNNSGVRDAGETGIGGVPILVEPIDTIAPQLPVTVTTGADGSYFVAGLMPGRYRVVEVTQPAGLQDGRDAAGTIGGRMVGTAINPGDRIIDVDLRGGDNGVNYNFGELPLGSLAGRVVLAPPGQDCFVNGQEAGTPLAGVEVQLYDIDGNLVATRRTGNDGRYLFQNLPTGQYTILETTPAGLIDGGSSPGRVRTLSGLTVATGQSSSGGTLWDIQLPAGGDGFEYDFCEASPGSVSGYVYHDRDNDGVRESGEEPIAGAVVTLINEAGQTVGRRTTGTDGFYEFAGLPPGTYRLVETQPDGYLDGRDTPGTFNGQTVGRTGDNDELVDIVLRQGLTGLEYNFGERLAASIGGRVHLDLDDDCVLDPGEQTLAGVSIELFDAAGTLVSTTTTDGSGEYRFENLTPGEYSVTEGAVEGTFDAGATVGTAGGRTDGPNRILAVTLGSGENATGYDFCENPPAEIAGQVFVDLDEDCVRDADEASLADVLIELIDAAGNVVATTRTAADGSYSFTGLRSGLYSIRETQPAGFFHGGQMAGSGGGDASVADLISAIDIGWGQSLTDYDFCEEPPASIAGTVFADLNEDYVQQVNERGIEGVRIELIDSGGNVVGTTLTDGEGTYRFTGLPKGTYSIRETQPEGYFQGGQMAGSGGGDASIPDLISQIVISPGATLIDYDFCEQPPSSIAGLVFADLDDDCVRDPDEDPIEGVLIELIDAAGQTVATTRTAADGTYQFDNLRAGQYSVRETQPEGYFQGGQMAGSGGGDASVDDLISNITIGPGRALTDYDFCEQLPASIAGRVWSESLIDPAVTRFEFDADETPIPDVRIDLINTAGVVVATTRTDEAGDYRFDNLMPGNYEVREFQPAGFFQGGQFLGEIEGNIVGRIVGTDRLGEVTLGSGDAGIRYDFPEFIPVTISGYVFQDGGALVATDAPDPARLREFRDGARTEDDASIPGVRLELRNALGRTLDVSKFSLDGLYAGETIAVTTGPDGYYEFTGLAPGTVYSIFQVQPDGFVDSLDTPGDAASVAINAADVSSNELVALSIRTLSVDPATDPKFDAILNVSLSPGGVSRNNNFSEIVLQAPPPPPPPPPEPPVVPPPQPPVVPPPLLPPQTPAPPPPVAIVRTPLETFDPAVRLVAFGQPLDIVPPPIYEDEWLVSWHLSVINGGFPAGSVAIGGLATIQPVAYRVADLGEQARDFDRLRDRFVVLSGDFDGDGIDEAVRFAAGQWFIDLNGNGIWDDGDLWARLGTELDRPVVGDWDGDGKDDIGIFGRRWNGDDSRIRRDPGLPDPANVRRRHLDRRTNTPADAVESRDDERIVRRGNGPLRADAVDHVFAYGEQPDTPVAGDWNGEGIDQIGVYRAGQWRLDEDGDGRWTSRDEPVTFGQPGDTPIVGDYNGDGIDEIGVIRDGVWIVDSDGDRRLTGNDLRIVVTGERTEDALPVVGDFSGDGRDEARWVRRAG